MTRVEGKLRDEVQTFITQAEHHTQKAIEQMTLAKDLLAMSGEQEAAERAQEIIGILQWLL